MVKGFIFFRTGKIPFVIENYRMDLFTDDSLLEIFCKEYNFKENYILQGQCFDIGPHGRKATFNEYPQLLSQTNLSAEKVSNQIKEIRRTIAHGYAYYYDFKNDRSSKYLMILLDKLIRCMSLKLIGFSNDDISNFMPFYP